MREADFVTPERYRKQSDFAAPTIEIAAIALNVQGFKQLIVDLSTVYTPDHPITSVWRENIIRDIAEGNNKYTKPISPSGVIKTHHQARKEYLENMGI